MIHSHTFEVQKTAHYYSIGLAAPQIRELWIVCHGYGQLASDFIADFEVLDNGERLIIAPEGLSRFYWGGFTGPVAASWMTSKDRLDEINDYCNYLNLLLAHVRQGLADDITIVLLGFSQGSATLCRWIARDQPAFDHLILWAGLFPEDIDYQPLQPYLNQRKLYFVYGLEDRFLTQARMEAHDQLIAAQQLDVERIAFEGKHKIEGEVLVLLAGRWGENGGV